MPVVCDRPAIRVTKQTKPMAPWSATATALRAAILGIADNLIVSNHHFQVVLATQWQAQGKNSAAHECVKIAMRFCRIAFQMVAGRQVFRHISIQGRHYILDKLFAFHRDHDTGMIEVLRDLQSAIGHILVREHAARPSRWPRNGRSNPGRSSSGSATCWAGDPAVGVGTPGGRRGTITRVRGVDPVASV